MSHKQDPGSILMDLDQLEPADAAPQPEHLFQHAPELADAALYALKALQAASHNLPSHEWQELMTAAHKLREALAKAGQL